MFRETDVIVFSKSQYCKKPNSEGLCFLGVLCRFDRHWTYTDQDFNEPVGDTNHNCSGGSTDSETVWSLLTAVEFTNMQECLQVVHERCPGKIASIWKLEGWLTDSTGVCLKQVILQGSDGTYTRVWLSYGEPGFFPEGVSLRFLWLGHAHCM